jgi:hypothetical protein
MVVMLVFNYFILYEIAQKQVRPTKNVPVRLVLRKTVVALTNGSPACWQWRGRSSFVVEQVMD